jgi:peptidoglycan/LPS O-acetylase OafA/YrhL
MRGFLVSLLLNAAFGSGVPNFFQPSGWFARSRRRQRELAAGVDADLVLANRKRYRLGLGLFCFGLLIIVLGAGSHVNHAARVIALSVGFASLAIGFVVLEWARRERSWLDEPDPEKPPSIFKI